MLVILHLQCVCVYVRVCVCVESVENLLAEINNKNNLKIILLKDGVPCNDY